MRAAAEGVPDEPPDLRLVLPAVAAWVVAWSVVRLPPRPVLAAAVVLAVVGVALLRGRRTTLAAVLL